MVEILQKLGTYKDAADQLWENRNAVAADLIHKAEESYDDFVEWAGQEYDEFVESLATDEVEDTATPKETTPESTPQISLAAAIVPPLTAGASEPSDDVSPQTEYTQVAPEITLRDGSTYKLDTANNRFIVTKEGETSTIEIKSDQTWGTPIQMTQRTGEGFWVTYSGPGDGSGFVAAIDKKGRVIQSISLAVPQHDILPLLALESNGYLFITGRNGEIVKVNPANNEVSLIRTAPIQEENAISAQTPATASAQPPATGWWSSRHEVRTTFWGLLDEEVRLGINPSNVVNFCTSMAVGILEPNNDWEYTSTRDLALVQTEQVNTYSDIPANQPTDILPLENGSFIVLDGYQNRFIVKNGSENRVVEITGNNDGAMGRPVRIFPRSEGGYWITYPNPANEETSACIAQVNEAGQIAGKITISPPPIQGTVPRDLSPVCVLEADGYLFVGGEHNTIARINLDSGEINWLSNLDPEADDFQLITDLTLSNGMIVAAAPLQKKIYVLDQEGTFSASFGQPGLSTGTMKTPISVAITPEGYFLVADHAFGAVQLFDWEGNCLGTVSHEGYFLSIENPVAIRALPGNSRRYALLDQKGSHITTFTISKEATIAAIPNGDTNFLRTHYFAEPGDFAASNNGRSCQVCHTGFVEDNREMWDENYMSHFVGPIDEDSRVSGDHLLSATEMTCADCHDLHPHHGEEHGEPKDTTYLEHGALRLENPDQGVTQICVTCHGEDEAHQTSSAFDLQYAHPMGATLREEMGERPDRRSRALASELGAGCYVCHQTHATPNDYLIRDSEDGEEACFTCHEGRSTTDFNHPLGSFAIDPTDVTSASIMTGNEQIVGCATCHGMASDTSESLVRNSEEENISVCIDCHDEVTGGHSEVTDASEIMCLGCHGVHFEQGRRAPSALLDGGCTYCHSAGGENPIPSEFVRRRGQPGGHPLHSGQSGLDNCSECHGEAHALREASLDNCTNCHEEEERAVAQAGHSEESCTDCHSEASFTPTCESCHTDGTTDPQIRFTDHINGNAFKPGGEFGPLECDDCHVEAHDGSRVGDDNKMLRPDFTDRFDCGGCHDRPGELDENLPKFHTDQKKKK